MSFHLTLAGAACAALAIAGPARSENAPLFPASALRDAIAGETFGHRGIRRSGAVAEAFAEGYIAALSDIAEERGTWCGASIILPHEVTARIYEYLNRMGADAERMPADAATFAIFEAIAPCKPE